MPGGNRRGRMAPRIPRTMNNTGGGAEGNNQEEDGILQVEINAEHSAGIRETEDFFKSAKTVQDHNRRLMEMIKWVEQEYPDYYENGVVELAEEQKENKKRYHTSTHDFIYTNINVNIMKAFMSKKKYKPNKFTLEGKPIHYSYSHLRKYYDSVLFGAYRAKVALPEIYEMEMQGFLDSVKKEKVKAKKRGEVEEKEADPISFELYRLLCKYAINAGNIFVWAFTVVQWSCMARSISIDDLTFAQVSLGTDSMVIEYCDSKADQKGEKTSPKNCYANPFDYRVCIFTALGCYFCIHDECWREQKDSIFRNRNAKQGTAAHRYCNQISKMYQEHKEEIEEYVRANHFNPHGTRKGAAVCASSGTTLPASLAAIANRGEWTISMMFEIYLGFAEPGDQYLGRLLAGLLPNSADFAVIPPHFTCGMENEFVNEAMNLCFRGIIERDEGGNVSSLRSNAKGILLRCLACMVYHYDELKKITIANPSHCFATMPLFTRPQLQLELSKLITMEVSDRIRMPTGIPPHVEAMGKLDELTKLIRQEREERLHHYEEIKATIGDKIEQIAEQNGQITRPAVIKLFEDFSEKFQTTITDKIDTVLRSVVGPTGGDGSNTEQNNQSTIQENTSMERSTGYTLWSYKGKFWHVPEDFALPAKTKRKRAWELWICGMELEDGKKIRPFRFMKPTCIPNEHRIKFKTEWQPIMKKMEKAEGLMMPAMGCYDAPNSTFIEMTYRVATKHLKENVCSFLWDDEKRIIENWSVASWSCYTQPNYIRKHGNVSDIANLPQVTRYNAPHRTRRRMTKRKVTEISEITEEIVETEITEV